jgi:16S rRNA (guanine966-N2)-methyltransferase
VREALFSALAARDALAGATVLDLYAGSGALGLEAASRGALRVDLVESDRRAAATIRANIAALDLPGLTVHACSVAAWLARPAPTAYDVVLLDPPYDLGEDALGGDLAALAGGGWLAGDALIVVERSSRSPEPTWPAGLTPGRARRYGETVLWLADC